MSRCGAERHLGPHTTGPAEDGLALVPHAELATTVEHVEERFGAVGRTRKCPGIPTPSSSIPARRPTSLLSTASVIGIPTRRVSTWGQQRVARVVVVLRVAGEALLENSRWTSAPGGDARGQPVQLREPASLVQARIGSGSQPPGRPGPAGDPVFPVSSANHAQRPHRSSAPAGHARRTVRRADR